MVFGHKGLRGELEAERRRRFSEIESFLEHLEQTVGSVKTEALSFLPPKRRCRIPQETLDYTMGLLHDEPETLKECCIVSKPWIPRTRKHSFADIKFSSADNPEFMEDVPGSFI